MQVLYCLFISVLLLEIQLSEEGGECRDPLTNLTVILFVYFCIVVRDPIIRGVGSVGIL